jgi:hypothetical protein
MTPHLNSPGLKVEKPSLGIQVLSSDLIVELILRLEIIGHDLITVESFTPPSAQLPKNRKGRRDEM